MIGLVNFQLYAQNPYLFVYNIFIKILYMFRALPCSSSGGLRRIIVYIIIIIIIIFNLRTPAFKACCAIWVRRFNFRRQASPRVSPCESTQRRKVELWARNVREFCLNAEFHVTFRDLLHAVKLRHGTDGFTSGCEPANLGTKGQHATSRPPKPLNCIRAASGIVTLKIVSCLQLLYYNLLHCL
jgi:hypothetical protein